MAYQRGSNPSCCFHEGAFHVVAQDFGRLCYYRDEVLIEEIAIDPGSGFPKIASIGGTLYVAVRDAATGKLFRDGLRDPIVFGTPGGNHPIVFSDGWIYWQEETPDLDRRGVCRTSVDNPSALVNVTHRLTPTGIYGVLGGEPIFLDDVEASVPGMRKPRRIGTLVCGEGPAGGAVIRDGAREKILWPGEIAFEPDFAVSGDTIGIVSWDVASVKSVMILRSELGEPETPEPVDMPDVRPLPRKMWFAPFFSHSAQYGDTPMDRHVGNLIWTLPSDLDRIRPLAPMVVATDAPIPEVNLNTTIAWWVTGATIADLETTVRRALTLPEKPIIAYLDSRDWPAVRPDWVTDRVWPGVQCYRQSGESIDAMRGAMERILTPMASWNVYSVLTPRFDDVNGTQSVSFTLEAMPLYDELLRRFLVCGFMPFSDRRGHGISADPALRAWAQAFLNANPGRPNRFDYWTSTTNDIETVLRNKLGQTIEMVFLSQAEKQYLLSKIGVPTPIPDPPPNSDHAPIIPNFLELTRSHWTARDMTRREHEVHDAAGGGEAGKAAIYKLQVHWTREVGLEIERQLGPVVYHEAANPIPGTEIRVHPAILLIDGHSLDGGPAKTLSCKLISGSQDDNWTFGTPNWNVDDRPDSADKRDLHTTDIGPSPF
jgi:hypothetical protein